MTALILESQKDDDDVVVKQELRTHTNLALNIYKQFNNYLKMKYTGNEEDITQNTDKEFDTIVNLGLIQAKESLSSNNSSLLHKERKPRKDVWEKLGRIAKVLLDCNTYPKVPGDTILQILNKVLPHGDPRVIRDYRKTVLSYCNIQEDVIERCTSDNRLGELDVSFFVELIPKQYITTSSTSSS